jgi:HAMP domain-containing protein
MTAPAAESDANPPKLRWTTRLLAGVGGLAAAAVSFGLAVWDKREAPEIPRVEAGQRVEAGRWIVTLISARAADETPDGRPSRGGRKAVIVDLSLENRTAETSNVYYDVLKIEGLPPGADQKPMLYLARDKELLSGLQPRLAERVSAVWLWPAGVAPPERLGVTIQADRFKPRDNLYAAPLWTNRYAAGAASLKIAPERERL